MKLEELFENTDMTLDLEPKNVQSMSLLKGRKPLGQGQQAVVVPHPRSNTVIKKVRIPGGDIQADPYVNFLKLVKKVDNPFFPTIYSVKAYRTPSTKGRFRTVPGELFLVVHMEKLHPATPKLIDSIKQLLPELGFEGETELSNDLFDQPNWRRQIRAKTKNPQLKQALRLLEPMFRLFGSDLHTQNWMVRLTSVGPQLVIIDPFYDFAADF